jgi:hypothetical protein
MTKYLQGLEKRFRNPLFLTAFAGIVYNLLKHLGVSIPETDFRTIADVISYLFMGAGIYASYDAKQGKI